MESNSSDSDGDSVPTVSQVQGSFSLSHLAHPVPSSLGEERPWLAAAMPFHIATWSSFGHELHQPPKAGCEGLVQVSALLAPLLLFSLSVLYTRLKSY